MSKFETSSCQNTEKVIQMPRKPTDKVIEHRISLSDFERKHLDKYLKQHNTSMWVGAVGGSSGPLLLGVAALGAVGVLALWKAPQLKDIIGETMDDLFTTLTDPRTYTKSPLDSFTIIRYRILAKEFADERNTLNRERSAYCTFSASTYDEAKCSMVFPKLENWHERLVAFQAMVYRELPNQKDRDQVFGGLGTVNPRGDTNPFNDENPEITSAYESRPTSASINQAAVTVAFLSNKNVQGPVDGDRHLWTFSAEDSPGGTVWTANLGFVDGMWWIPDDFDDLYTRQPRGGGRRGDGEGGSIDTGPPADEDAPPPPARQERREGSGGNQSRRDSPKSSRGGGRRGGGRSGV
jgi:hypothetical protein